jgi:membrane protease YdiL (CAAX protease family)
MHHMKNTLLHVLTSLVLIAVAIAVARRKGGGVRDVLALRAPSPGRALLFLAGFLVLCAATESLTRALGEGKVEPWSFPAAVLALRVLGVVVLAPVSEELLFRGLLYQKLSRNGERPWRAILIVAVLFALSHYRPGGDAMAITIMLGQPLVDSIYFGVARYRTDSVITPTVLHMIGNSIAAGQRLGWWLT